MSRAALARWRIALFVLMVIAFSTPFWLLHRQSGHSAYIALLMWCPGLAGLLTLRITGGRAASLGWRGVRLRWVFAGCAATALGLFAAYAAVWAMGLASFPDPEAVRHVARTTGLTNLDLPALVLAQAGLSLTAGVINAGARALGEELGWRGFLVPETTAAMGFLPGALFGGVIWALWHFPLMVGRASGAGLVNFTLMVVGLGVAYAWVRERTDSVWIPTVMHATHNGFRSGFLNPLTLGFAGSGLWLDETGYTLAALGVLLGAAAAAAHLFTRREASPTPA